MAKVKTRLGLAVLAVLAAPAAADESDDALAFRVWLDGYRREAPARGLDPAWIEATLVGATFLPRVVRLDRGQPDDHGRQPLFTDYLAGKFAGDRVPAGQSRVLANRALLDAAAAQTGVPGPMIAAIWGIETSYGRVTGTFDLPSALATLAFDGRRRALFTGELDALVRMIGDGRMARDAARGSWAGAFGQAQFLPTSYLRHGQDGDGDGRVDLADSLPDVFASIGRYLADSGWQRGVGWGFRTVVPAGFDRTRVASTETFASCAAARGKHSRWRPARDWRADGFMAVNAGWPADAVPMTLVEPDGPGQGAFLTTASYRAIMQYNCSNFYALSVGLLADAIAPPGD